MKRRWSVVRSSGIVGTIIFCLCGARSGAAQSTNPGTEVSHRVLGQQPAQQTVEAPDEQPVPHTDGVADRVVSLSLHNVTLDSALTAIRSEAGVTISYGSLVVPLDRRVSLEAKQMPLMDALRSILRGTDVSVKVSTTGKLELVRTKPPATRSRTQQGNGIIQGKVTDAKTGDPLSGVVIAIKDAPKNVYASGSRIPDGFYSIFNVPPGDYVLVARRLGYLSKEERVTVKSGDTATVQFTLTAVPQVLQGVVTTGAGEREKLEVGNAISSINADSIVKTTPIRNISDLIKGRASGVDVLSSGGTVGSGSRIRIRGESSLLTGEDPIVIVDGVRVDGAYTRSSIGQLLQVNGLRMVPMANSASRLSVPASSRLNDIDPESIESIEVLKGPAASALYGSDAANGVIVIKTKRGKPGATRWNVSGTAGVSNVTAKFPENYFGWGKAYGAIQTSANCNISAIVSKQCTQDSVTHYNPLNHDATSPFKTGSREELNAQVSGGSEWLQFFVSGTYDNEIGPLGFPSALKASTISQLSGNPLPSWANRPNVLNATALSTTLTDQFKHGDITLTSNVRRQYHRDVPEGSNGFVSAALSAPGFLDTLTDGWGTTTPASSFLTRNDDRVTRGFGSLTGNWRPTGYLSGRATAGVDYSSTDNQSLLKAEDVFSHSYPANTSARNRTQASNLMKTGDLNATLDIPFTSALQLRSTAGTQYTSTTYSALGVTGSGIPVGGTTITGASQMNVYEFNGEQATVGWYVQEIASLNQRLFMTVAVRGDASSAFGAQAKSVAYPKWNASWLISQEPFFPHIPLLSSLRLRAGFGHAGSQPPFDARFRTYQYTSGYANNQTSNTVFINSVGNTELLPEKSVETEGGFDVGFGQDRLTMGLTLENKITRNALVVRPLPGSFGLQMTQTQNIGKIGNHNLEFETTIRPLDQAAISWSSTVLLTRTWNKVISLGPTGPTPVQAGLISAQSRFVEGYPVDGIWARAIVGYNDVNHDKIIEQNEVLLTDSVIYGGHTSPSATVGWQNSVALFSGRFVVGMNFTYEGGATQYNQLLANQCSTGYCRGAVDSSASFAQQTLATGLTDWPFLEHVSAFRFNELSLTFNASPSFARMLHSQSASVSLMGQNLKLWSHYRGVDPNVNTSTLGGDNVTDAGTVPQPRNWTVRINLGF